jgi:hypothetical protein
MSRPPGTGSGAYAFRPDDPEPCLGCKHRAKCETGFACDRFAQWVNTGRNDPALSPVPMRSMFEQLFLDAEQTGSDRRLVPAFQDDRNSVLTSERYGSTAGRKSTSAAAVAVTCQVRGAPRA